MCGGVREGGEVASQLLLLALVTSPSFLATIPNRGVCSSKRRLRVARLGVSL
jgi:hypothetical protein